MPRAHIIIAPDVTPRQDCGRVTWVKTCRRFAPSIMAAFSSSGSTSEKASRLALTRKGKPTKTIAATMPPIESTKKSPAFANRLPSIPRLPNTIRRAMPAAVCGMITGKTTSPSTNAFPVKFRRASTQASGTPKTKPSKVAMMPARKLVPIDLRTSWSVMTARSSPGPVVNTVTARGRTTINTATLARNISRVENHCLRLTISYPPGWTRGCSDSGRLAGWSTVTGSSRG